MDGPAATRALPGGGALPVVGMTRAGSQEWQECLSAGILDVLLEPG